MTLANSNAPPVISTENGAKFILQGAEQG